MRGLPTVWSAGVFCLLQLGCDGSHPGAVDSVSVNDPEMNQAITQARSTMSRFNEAFGQRHADTDLFFLKKPYATPDGGTEHMWITIKEESSEGYVGTVNNDAEMTKLTRLGQPATVKLSEASDWYFVKNGVMHGGYTIRCSMKKMKPTERAELLLRMPYKMAAENE